MKLTIRIFCLLFFIATLAEAATQRKIPSYEKYIKTYSALAIEQQKKYKIPASITLAQGLLESGKATWHAAQTTTSASNVIPTGAADVFIMTTTCVENVSVNTNGWKIHMKITPNF